MIHSLINWKYSFWTFCTDPVFELSAQLLFLIYFQECIMTLGEVCWLFEMALYVKFKGQLIFIIFNALKMTESALYIYNAIEADM